MKTRRNSGLPQLQKPPSLFLLIAQAIKLSMTWN